ncbi:MAG: hypothetical protein GY802_21730 [Gammaproteobacteria bacterium]|nr:hypothetical protein [Gammaproteobacteria bacterium]
MSRAHDNRRSAATLVTEILTGLRDLLLAPDKLPVAQENTLDLALEKQIVGVTFRRQRCGFKQGLALRGIGGGIKQMI